MSILKVKKWRHRNSVLLSIKQNRSWTLDITGGIVARTVRTQGPSGNTQGRDAALLMKGLKKQVLQAEKFTVKMVRS